MNEYVEVSPMVQVCNHVRPFYFDPCGVESMYWRNDKNILSDDHNMLVICMRGGGEYYLNKENGKNFISEYVDSDRIYYDNKFSE